MDPMDSGQSFLGLMASIQQGGLNFEPSNFKTIHPIGDVPKGGGGNLHSALSVAPEANKQIETPISTAPEAINMSSYSTGAQNTTKIVKACNETRQVFFEAMSKETEDDFTEKSTEETNSHVCSEYEAGLSDSDFMYDSSASSSRRRKRKWAGTDLLMGNPNFAGAIEKAIRNADKRASANICQPYEGQCFDSLAEAYQFYNLHSWESGFSIRHGTSQTNTKKDQRNMQQFDCQRAGKPRKNQKKTTRCGCPARMRLLRCSTGGYYVKTLVAEHNHSLVESCGEKRHLFSHKSIDESTKQMVRHLRENNVSLSKVNCIMGSMHGSMSAVPFTKNTLRSVCAEIAQDHLQDDVMKTMQLFKELSKDDPNFRFSVQLDEVDGKVNSPRRGKITRGESDEINEYNNTAVGTMVGPLVGPVDVTLWVNTGDK